MERACQHVLVRGRVQGVAFRWYARERAAELGVAGWVRNLEDGRVEAWIEGEPQAVAAMLAWLHEGPPAARVESVVAHEDQPRGLADFDVQPSAQAPRS